MPEHLLEILETDLRALSVEARKNDGVAAHITGWFSGPEHPAIKEAAERTMLKLRSMSAKQEGLDPAKTSKEALKPFLMACESKNPKLASIALMSLQKLLASGIVPLEDMLTIIKALEQVEKLRDDVVQLKILQTALSLMQARALAENEAAVASVLGLCFRLLSDAKNSDSVVNTAAATVRQAVTLVFEHVLSEGQSHKQITGSRRPSSASGDGAAGEASVGDRPRRLSKLGSGLLAEQGAANAALKLLDELCMMATASSEAMLRWLRAPTLPRYFVLDLLDFVLTNTADVFRTVPAFEHTLLVRICQLLVTQLQNLLDPACDPATQATDLRITLRIVRTVLSKFYRQLRAKCGVFVETLLAGAESPCTLWQRINVMQVMRALCSDHHLLFFLFTSYDMRQDCKLNAVEEMVRCFSSMVESIVSSSKEDELASTMSALLQTGIPGKDWHVDGDIGNSSPETGVACLAMLAVDSLLGVVNALMMLTDTTIDGIEEAKSQSQPHSLQSAASGTLDEDPQVSRVASEGACVAMVETTWNMVLPALSLLLSKAQGEVLVLKLLRGYQAFTQASGLLRLTEPRDAFLSSLCSFTLASTAESASADGPAGPLSPKASKGHKDLSRATSVAGRQPGGAAASMEVADIVVLTPKNVHALRTLFNVAHRLHHLLGGAWALVLDNLNSLDRILEAPSTTTQEVSAQTGSAAHSSDLAILAVAARQLFESSRDMATEAVVAILMGLRTVSMRSIPHAASQPGTLKLFSLARMVEVLLYNLHRIHHLWPIFLDHLGELLTDERASVRAAAIDALGRAVGGALAHVTSGGNVTANGDPLEASAGSGAIPSTPQSPPYRPSEDGGAAEHMLMVALHMLYKDSQEAERPQFDVQMGIMRVVLQLLQRHGEQLSSGWTPVLRLLEAVPSAHGAAPALSDTGNTAVSKAAVVGLSFQSVQLLASDYMSSLPPHLLRTCLSVATLYARQQADMNVSLTAISLLWNAADLLSKLSAAPHRAHSQGGDFSSTSTTADNSSLPLDGQQFEELLRVLFVALQGVSTDPRPEVRNSSVRTLFSVVASHGARLSGPAWDEALWEILFPLMRLVHQMTASSSKEEAQAEILGKSKGEEVAMLVHHSRNSEQKQWDETLVLAISGMGRLLRQHLPLLRGMEAFPQGWEELMMVVESAIAGARREVALAAIAVITQMALAHGATPAMETYMWKRALRAVGVGVEAAASSSCLLPIQARLELVTAIGTLYTSLLTVLEASDLEEMYIWAERLARQPMSVDDPGLFVAGILPPVQKAALSLLPTLVPPQNLPQLWPKLLEALLRLVRPQILLLPSRPPSAGTTPSHNINKRALSCLAQERVVDTVAQLYRDQVPWEARSATFPAVVAALGSCLALRYTLPSSPLWRTAVQSFTTVVSAGLPAVNIAAVTGDESPPEGCWSSLAEAFEGFLLGPPHNPDDSSAAAAGPLYENDVVLTACAHAAEQDQSRLVAIVDRGAARPPGPEALSSTAGSRFRQHCLRKMYILCSRGVESHGTPNCLLPVAQQALPMFLSRAQGMLESAAASAAAAPEAARMDVDEFMCLLEVLHLMQLAPSVADAVIAPGTPLQALVALRRANKQLAMYSGAVEGNSANMAG
ncbi:hypothetical protein WJX73_008056 [Symbiochloris irregularis]|uniref:Protein MON2 homolog n=1 Tax=Symbiochloris irregularis TaxID=706552 RepID=A0AAW1PMI3_9CHLO